MRRKNTNSCKKYRSGTRKKRNGKAYDGNETELTNCSKVAYKTKNCARGAATKVMRLSEDCPYMLTVYKCPSCKMWHMTSQGKMENTIKVAELI